MVARLCQKVFRLSVPPNSVMKLVESTRRMSPLRSEWDGVTVRIHLLVVEVVVAHGVCAQFRIVTLGGEDQRGTAFPAAHELRG